MIFDISHVSLQVPDVDDAVQFVGEVLGMHEVDRVGDTAYVTLASPYPSLGARCSHHVLEFTQAEGAALDHIGLLVADESTLDRVVERAVDQGATRLGDHAEPGIGPAVRMAAPSGHVFELHPAMHHIEAVYEPRGVRPHRLGHVNLWSKDVTAFVKFCTHAFGFQVSDWIGDPGAAGDSACFMRCHFDHHTLATAAGALDGIYHYAFEMGSVESIGRLGDVLARRGTRFLWGPGRHGAGDNVAAYFTGPGGITVEVYADMQKILQPGWEPRRWDADELPRAANLWGPVGGRERMTHAPLARRVVIP